MTAGYKYKPEKHKFRNSLESIDEIHASQIDIFKIKRCAIAEKKAALIKLEQEYADININELGNETLFDKLKKRTQCKKSIQQLKNEIDKIENYNDELNYYSKTGDVLGEYYHITNGMLYGKIFDSENEKTIIPEPINTDHVIHISSELTDIINTHKKKKIKRTAVKRNKKNITSETHNIIELLTPSKIKQEAEIKQICKNELQNKYLWIMDTDYACMNTKQHIVKKCETCKINKTIIYNDAISYCPQCGVTDILLIESDVPSHDEIIKPKYPYKKIGHCIEKLNQFLCKGKANIPHYVMQTLEHEIKKHMIDKNDITINFIESIMKKYKYGDYYENIMFIFNKLTGRVAHTISHDLHESVIEYFKKADQTYEEKYKPSYRNNFLKYTFVLHKIFLIHGRPDIAQYFKLLKSPVILKEQERIWEKICNDNGWEYNGN